VVKRLLGLTAVTLVLSGCAHDAQWLQRQDPVQSTSGNDPNKAPAGKTIPPPGLGVDLGQRLPSANTSIRV
jgi:hypothetical protein